MFGEKKGTTLCPLSMLLNSGLPSTFREGEATVPRILTQPPHTDGSRAMEKQLFAGLSERLVDDRRALDAIFRPRNVALVGATEK
jgi:hypothetical protein